VADISNLTGSFLSGHAVVDYGVQLGDTRNLSVITGENVAIVQRSNITSEINAPTHVVSHVLTSDSNYTDMLLKSVMAQGTPRIFMRLGIVAGKDHFYLPFQEHIVTHFFSAPFQHGHRIEIHSKDRMWEISRADNKVRARRGKISDIVQVIAQENGLRFIIEPTRGTGNDVYIQSHEDDIEFILGRLLPRAVNDKGRGSYRLFIRDNVLHFHAPDYQAEVRQVNYFSSSTSVFLVTRDWTQSLVNNGAAGCVGIVYDPYTGTAETIMSSPNVVLNFGKVTPRLAEIRNGKVPLRYHLGTNRVDEVVALVQNQYEHAYSKLYEVELKMEKMPVIQVNDILNIIICSEAIASPWAGYYVVNKVEHHLNSGALSSTFSLSRGELNTSSTQFKTGATGLLTRENFVTGEAINVNVIASSKQVGGQTEQTTDGQVIKQVIKV